MRKSTLSVFCVLLITFVASCTSPGNVGVDTYNKETLEQNKARLIFKRENSFLSSGNAARIKIDGKLVTKLSNGASFYVDVPPGPTYIQVYGRFDPGQFQLDLNLEKNKSFLTLFFRVISSIRGNLN